MNNTSHKCMHGKTESLNAHDCIKCQQIAKFLKYDTSRGQIYFFTRQFIQNNLINLPKELE